MQIERTMTIKLSEKEIQMLTDFLEQNIIDDSEFDGSMPDTQEYHRFANALLNQIKHS